MNFYICLDIGEFFPIPIPIEEITGKIMKEFDQNYVVSEEFRIRASRNICATLQEFGDLRSESTARVVAQVLIRFEKTFIGLDPISLIYLASYATKHLEKYCQN